MHNIYLAARYSRHPQMRRCRDALTALGHVVTSRWIDCHNGALPDSLDHAALNGDPAAGTAFGQADVADLARADTVISFTTAEGGGKGGRHVEFGLALGLGKHLVIVGPRENVFHTLPGIEVHDSWEALLTAWAPLWPVSNVVTAVTEAVDR